MLNVSCALAIVAAERATAIVVKRIVKQVMVVSECGRVCLLTSTLS